MVHALLSSHFLLLFFFQGMLEKISEKNMAAMVASGAIEAKLTYPN
jgi:hypothetical protein